MAGASRIEEYLEFLYGTEVAGRVLPDLRRRLDEFYRHHPKLREDSPSPGERLTERDAFLITYGDQIAEPGKAPLRSLAEFLRERVADAIGGVHILPHFPYSSDDGFSVIDYWKVDPNLGTWDDVARLGENFRLMFDGVINHISQQSDWFKKFKRGEKPYTDYFICGEPSADLSMVVRPRTSPLLTPVETASGTKHVWTTFSDDQIDLNFKNPDVLLRIIDLLLFYAEQGAELIRMDAIAYLWKEPGTPCIHLPQTHCVVKLFRAVLDIAAPGVMLITETNVPHKDNISYFGDGTDEAQLVYNFALPPLILHTFATGNARVLTDWAATLKAPSPANTFFNFIASHDGIGVMPARGLLSDAEVQTLVDRTLAHGGKVSYKSNSDGSKSPYELNITLYDALNDPNHPHSDLDVRRFLASQAIMLTLAGVPGIYVHSLFGSRNWHAGLAQTGRARTINREKFQRTALEAELADPASLQSRVFAGYCKLLKARRAHPAFHPNAMQRVLSVSDSLFTVARGDAVLAMINVTGQPQAVEVAVTETGLKPATDWCDLVTGKTIRACGNHLTITVQPYETLWLAAK